LVKTIEESSRLPRPPEVNRHKIGQSNSKTFFVITFFKILQTNGRGRRVLILGVLQPFFPAYLAPTQGVSNSENLLQFT
jgi:hypothetical protein